MSANCLSQNAAIGTVTLFTVFPGFSASNFCLSSVITGSLFGSPHMKLGQLISAALLVNDQHRTAKTNVASRKCFITSSSSFTRSILATLTAVAVLHGHTIVSLRRVPKARRRKVNHGTGCLRLQC